MKSIITSSCDAVFFFFLGFLQSFCYPVTAGTTRVKAKKLQTVPIDFNGLRSKQKTTLLLLLLHFHRELRTLRSTFDLDVKQGPNLESF